MIPCLRQKNHTKALLLVHAQIVRVSQSMGGEVAFVADFPVGIKGVQFEVPSDTLMAFGAPLLTFEKEKVLAGSQATSSISRLNPLESPQQLTARCCFLAADLPFL